MYGPSVISLPAMVLRPECFTLERFPEHIQISSVRFLFIVAKTGHLVLALRHPAVHPNIFYNLLMSIVQMYNLFNFDCSSFGEEEITPNVRFSFHFEVLSLSLFENNKTIESFFKKRIWYCYLIAELIANGVYLPTYILGHDIYQSTLCLLHSITIIQSDAKWRNKWMKPTINPNLIESNN